ncbi:MULTISPECIES: DUF6291 domain-containing protein [unclassified Apibacter]|uniref:DUF6291 domain-containing protein n=1 Tax=unclassified Apibacter TaxID=2630820 RepID=UPI001325D7B1|nr:MULTISPECIES: DUF6291 domain-containing protein [unclassified Apibacter]MCX8676244.1 hypothetical protein [Apibacter sp. B3919]MXO23714.1 hypothetical protein [Apibacter sp. B3924]MXO26608.1 hypothetical protein [Apibacter sp. B3813]MXO29475.1 hypothetical protein [Apibacter sp. B3913]MXO31427.1 hypothetical protein [Apibacter sp. B3912]
MEERDSIIFYRSFFESIKQLPSETQAEVYNAIFEYSLNFKEVELSEIPKVIFTLIKPQLDANIRKYENGKKKGTRSKPEAKQKQARSKPEANQEQARSKPGASQEQARSKPEANQEQARSKPEANQEQARSKTGASQEQTRSKPGASQEQTRSKPEAKQEQTRSKPGANQKQNRSKTEANVECIMYNEECIMKNENEECIMKNENEECKMKDDVLLEKEPKASPLLKKVGGENQNLSGFYSTKEERKKDCEEIVNNFNDRCTYLPIVQKITDKRISSVSARIKEFGKEKVNEVIDMVSESTFLNGQNKQSWTADFDWIMSPANFIKILEGNYKNKDLRHETTDEDFTINR